MFERLLGAFFLALMTFLIVISSGHAIDNSTVLIKNLKITQNLDGDDDEFGADVPDNSSTEEDSDNSEDESDYNNDESDGSDGSDENEEDTSKSGDDSGEEQ